MLHVEERVTTVCESARRHVGVVCFFVQAEDGIRDVAVTGVQTCALPISLALALAAGASRAASVRGTLVGGNPAAPLEGAEVVLRRAADSTVVAHTTTGADGGFRVDSLAFDRYLLRASLIGYEPWRRSDVVLSAAASDLDLGRIELVLSPILVQSVDVSTARATAIMAPDRNVYLTRDLPSSNTGTATDLLRGVPELDVDIDGHVSLRGSSSVNVQFDGRVSPLKEIGRASCRERV